MVCACDILAATVPRLGPQFKRALIFVHRWMGVALCLLFFLWFSSGMAMMYWGYPLVSHDDRLTRATVLDAARIRLSPAEAYARLGLDMPPPAEARLAMFDGRPAYKFGRRADQSIVYGDNGEMQTTFPPAMTRRIAAAWSGQPAVSAKEEENVPIDQWTVSEEFTEVRPLRKYSWPDGEQVYVSTQTGEVAQYTTRASRRGAYLGPIPHWLYFTPLRRHGARWSVVVIWASALATTLGIIGIAVGVSMYSTAKRFRYQGVPSALPYVGWKRWHAILGLIFGVLACTWAFSGMLSMDPFPAWQGQPRNDIGARFEEAIRAQRIELAGFASKLPPEALAEAGGGVKEVELGSFLGRPVYLAYIGPNQTRVVPVVGRVSDEFDAEEIRGALEKAALPYLVSQLRTVRRYEPYYLDRRNQLPLPVIFAQLNDPDGSSFYIDPKTARVVESYNRRSRRNRWLYHGLHSLDLPALYAHRPAWDIVVLILMLGGASLSITSLILAGSVLRRKLQGNVRSAAAPAGKTVPAAP